MTYLLPFQNDGDPDRDFFQSPQDLSLDSPVCALKAVLLTSWPGFTVLCIISYGTLNLRKIHIRFIELTTDGFQVVVETFAIYSQLLCR